MGPGIEPGMRLGAEAQPSPFGLAGHHAGFQRHQLVADELLHEILEHAVLFGKFEVHWLPPASKLLFLPAS